VPTNRTPITRRRLPAATAEAVELFRRLEGTPGRLRRQQRFKDDEHQLMRLLDLVPEFWTMNSVLDRSLAPVYPEGYIARDHWFRCRAIREQLLAAAKGEPSAEPTEEITHAAAEFHGRGDGDD
jgi:hypothetical protein